LDNHILECTTPSTIRKIKPGTYDFRIDGTKIYSLSDKITIKANQNLEITPELFKYCWIEFSSHFRNLTLEAENNILKPKQKLKLKPGIYTFEPSFDYLPPIKIDIKPGEDIVIDYDKQISQRNIKF